MNFSELFKQTNQLCKFSPDGRYLVSRNMSRARSDGIFPKSDFLYLVGKQVTIQVVIDLHYM